MTRFATALSAAALLLAGLALPAAADLVAPSKAGLAQSSMVQKAACNGRTGRYGCGPGWIWRCHNGHCRCRPC